MKDLKKIKEFVKERNRLLLDMDVAGMEIFARMYNLPVPDNPRSFMAGMHKARIEIESMPEEKKEESRMWLRRNNFSIPGEYH